MPPFIKGLYKQIVFNLNLLLNYDSSITSCLLNFRYKCYNYLMRSN